MNSLDDPTRPLPTLTLSIRTVGAPAVQLIYYPDRPIEESAVTVLDQTSVTRAWSLEDVVKDALLFLLVYVRARRAWPAELRSLCAGRKNPDERSACTTQGDDVSS
jgi:hypothetical protein